jgi:transposase
MGQISVLTGPERRRRWSEDERCRIVAEAFAPGSCVAQVARNHDISTGLIYTWRRWLRQDLADQGFVEAAMEAEPIKEEAARSGEVIVVELTGSGRIRICGSAPPSLVSAVLKALR